MAYTLRAQGPEGEELETCTEENPFVFRVGQDEALEAFEQGLMAFISSTSLKTWNLHLQVVKDASNGPVRAASGVESKEIRLEANRARRVCAAIDAAEYTCKGVHEQRMAVPLRLEEKARVHADVRARVDEDVGAAVRPGLDPEVEVVASVHVSMRSHVQKRCELRAVKGEV